MGNRRYLANTVRSCLAYSLRTSFKEIFRANNLITEKLDRFDSTLREVNQARRLLLIHRCNQRCTLLRLPSEIITNILHEALELFDPNLWSFSALVNLASVSKCFARTLRSSCFWPVLNARDSQTTLRAVLTRNPGGPLVVTAESDCTDEELATLLELATPHQQRWRTFSFTVPNDSEEQEKLWSVLAGPTPLLIHLELNSRDPPSPIFPSLGPGCAISSLTLSYVSIPQYSDRLGGLRILNLAYYGDDGAPKLAELVKLIERLLELRYLELHLDFDDERLEDTFPQCEAIHLPNLASILLSGPSPHCGFLVPRISSNSCSRYSYDINLHPSLFDLGIGFGFLHTLSSVVQGLHQLDIQYTNFPSLRLLGSSSHHAPVTDLDLSFRVDNPNSSTWRKLAAFLSSALNPAAQVRLCVKAWRETARTSSPDFLELIKYLETIAFLRICGTSNVSNLIEAYCPALPLSSSPHSRETVVRCQRLRSLSLDSRYVGEFTARTVVQFIRSVIEIQDSSVGKSPMGVEKASFGLWCSKDLYEPIAACLPLEWFSSGRIVWKEPVPYHDGDWVGFPKEQAIHESH